MTKIPLCYTCRYRYTVGELCSSCVVDPKHPKFEIKGCSNCFWRNKSLSPCAECSPLANYNYWRNDVNPWKGETSSMRTTLISLYPKKIITNGPATIVFWSDDTKTVVKCAKGETQDVYIAFTAALAKRIFGSNSKLKKLIKKNLKEQTPS